VKDTFGDGLGARFYRPEPGSLRCQNLFEGGGGKGYVGGMRQARAGRYGSTVNLDVLLRVRVLLGKRFGVNKKTVS